MTSIALSGIAQAETLASWDFDEADAPDPALRTIVADAQSANVNTAQVSMTSGLTPRGTGTQIWGDVFSTIGWADGSLADALTDNEYITITVTPQDGMMLNLTNLNIRIERAASAEAGVLFSSAVGFNEGDQIATTVEFRLYFHGSGGDWDGAGIGKAGGSGVGVNDLEVQGTTDSAAQRGTLFLVK